jgi:hypothetical protein
MCEATPKGTYLIDLVRTHEEHEIDWCNLHREMADGTGFYGYT